MFLDEVPVRLFAKALIIDSTLSKLSSRKIKSWITSSLRPAPECLYFDRRLRNNADAHISSLAVIPYIVCGAAGSFSQNLQDTVLLLTSDCLDCLWCRLHLECLTRRIKFGILISGRIGKYVVQQSSHWNDPASQEKTLWKPETNKISTVLTYAFS